MNNDVKKLNRNFRYFIWTIVGIIAIISLSSAYVYITDTKLDMDNQVINNVSDPVNPQDAATKAYIDANSGGKSFMAFKTYQTIIINDPRYCFIDGKSFSAVNICADTEDYVEIRVPINGTLSDFIANVGTSSKDAGNTYIVLRKNRSSVLTFTYASSETGIKTNSSEIDVSVNDTINWYFYTDDQSGGGFGDVDISFTFKQR